MPESIPADALRQIRRLQIRARRAVDSLAGGEYHSAFKGTGLSFEDVREYQPGDDVRRIDWNVTARTGKPFLKRFVEERELTILLAVDLSGSMAFGSASNTKRGVAAEAAALLTFAALANGDRVGLFAFTDRIERYVPPRRGSRHALRMLRDILHYHPSGRGTDYPAALNEILRIQQRRAVVFLISDFQGFEVIPFLRRVAVRHDLILLRIADDRELDWPDIGLIRVTDPETGTTSLLESKTLQSEYHKIATERVEWEKQVRGADAEIVNLGTAGGHFDAIVEFLRHRQRRGQA